MSNSYSKSPSVYSMTSAFIAMPIAAKREMSMNLKVNILFILKMFFANGSLLAVNGKTVWHTNAKNVEPVLS